MTAEPLREAAIEPVVPDRYRLGALVRLVFDELTQRHIQRFRYEGVTLELRGHLVSVDSRRVALGPNSLALLLALASSDSVLSTKTSSRARQMILMSTLCTWRSVGCAERSGCLD